MSRQLAFSVLKFVFRKQRFLSKPLGCRIPWPDAFAPIASLPKHFDPVGGVIRPQASPEYPRHYAEENPNQIDVCQVDKGRQTVRLYLTPQSGADAREFLEFEYVYTLKR